MSQIRSNIHLKHLEGRFGNMLYEMTRVQFSQSPKAWSPAVNVYRCDSCVVVCVDLAGVESKTVQLKIESQRLSIQGTREAPEPRGHGNKPVQILAMEIDYGAFERELLLPADVDPAKASAEHDNGLLWIYLPLRPHA